MVKAERDVIGAGHGAIGVERHGVGRGAAGSDHAQRCGVELRMGSGIESLLGVVLQHLVDDFLHRMLGQVVQLAGVGDRVAVLGDGHRALRDGEVGFRHRRGFGQNRTLRRDIGIDVPVEGVALALALDGSVLDIGELAELAQRLNGVAQHLGQIVRVHVAT